MCIPHESTKKVGALEKTTRFEKEEQFHDQWAAATELEQVRYREAMEAATRPETRRIIAELGDISGKRLLDLGSGLGEASVYFATLGANVIAADLSHSMLCFDRRLAEKHGVDIQMAQTPSEHLPFRSGSFDIIYAGNLLHHVNIEQTLTEIHRVLKNGGTFVSWDPLAYNPIINIYRKIAVGVRTKDEHPLRIKNFLTIKSHFSLVRWECYWFFALLIFMKMYVWDRINPNRVRYWHYIVDEHERLTKAFLFLDGLDRIFLRCFPVFKWFCYNIVIIAKK